MDIRAGYRTLPVLVALIALSPLTVYAFGDAADQMCNHPEKFIDGKPSSYTEMNPQSPDYKKSGVIGQPCNDGAMASGYCTTIVKAGPGTGCLATKCAGTDCKQAKPGEQPQQPPQEQKPPGDQQGQQDQGKGGQMPEVPKPQGGGGSGGGQPQQPQQTPNKDCTISGALGMPCPEPVSTHLGTGGSSQNPGDLLSQIASENDGGTVAGEGVTPTSLVADRLSSLNRGLSDLWHKITGTSAPGDPADSAGTVDDYQAVSNSTFSGPSANSGSFTLERKQSLIGSWFERFQSLFQ